MTTTVSVRIGTLLAPQTLEIELTDSSVFAPTFLARLFLDEMATMSLEGLRVLDVGCGSGVLSVAAGLGGAHVTAIDISEEALTCTALNAKNHGLDVDIRQSDGLAAIGPEERFDFILANAPGAPPSMTTKQNAPVDRGEADDPLLVEAITRGPAMTAPAGVMITWGNDLLGLAPMEALMRQHWDTLEVRRDIETLINNETGLRIWGFNRERLIAEGRINTDDGRDFVGLRLYRLARWR